VDFLLVLIELFSLGVSVTTESYFRSRLLVPSYPNTKYCEHVSSYLLCERYDKIMLAEAYFINTPCIYMYRATLPYRM